MSLHCYSFAYAAPARSPALQPLPFVQPEPLHPLLAALCLLRLALLLASRGRCRSGLVAANTGSLTLQLPRSEPQLTRLVVRQFQARHGSVDTAQSHRKQLMLGYT